MVIEVENEAGGEGLTERLKEQRARGPHERAQEGPA